MNSNFNRQFIMLDFRLLRNREFLKLLGSSEFATYLVLRGHVWRSSQPHYMGLEQLYGREKKLACSLTREKISDVTGIAPDNISRHLSALQDQGLIERQRTGRQSVFVLGEWIDVKGDGSYHLEWFYLEGQYGIAKDDLTESVRSDLTKTSDQIWPPASGQTRRKASDNNRKENRQEKTVANGGIQRLQDLEQPQARTDYVAQTILKQLGDKHSLKFYQLIAAKVPEAEVRRALSEIKVDGARAPAKLFTYKMKRYALQQLKGRIG
jgi:DNA-binding transcriptional ArsR family regulator